MLNVKRDLTDKELVAAIVAGDVEQFQSLMERHGGRVMRLVRRRIPAEHCDEVFQNVFVAVFKSLPGFRGESPFEHWLVRLCLNQCRDFWRAQGRRREIAESKLSDREKEEVRLILRAQGDSQQSERDRSIDLQKALRWCMSQLSVADKDLMLLAHVEQQPIKEVAAVLGLTESNAKVRAHRVRNRLRELLVRFCDGGESL